MKYIIRKVPERNTRYLERLLPDAVVVNDVNHNGCIWSFLKAIETDDDDAVYIQDDILLCKDFRKKAEEYISKYPSDVIVFCFPVQKNNKNASWFCQVKKEGFYSAKDGCYLLCTYIPKKIACLFYDFCISGECETIGAYKKYIKMQADDLMFNRFLEKKDFNNVFVTIPNLAGHEENVSVTVKSRPKRISPMFDYENCEKKVSSEV